MNKKLTYDSLSVVICDHSYICTHFKDKLHQKPLMEPYGRYHKTFHKVLYPFSNSSEIFHLRGTVSFLEIVFVGQCEVFVCLGQCEVFICL